MKNIFLTLFVLLNFQSFSFELKSINPNDIDTLDNSKFVNFDNLGGVIYEDEVDYLIIDFDRNIGHKVIIDDSLCIQSSDGLIVLSELGLGDHMVALKIEGKKSLKKKKFKYNKSAPFISNDGVVFGLLLLILVIIFKTSDNTSFKRFYKVVPALLLCYFIPAILNSLNIISSDESSLYFVASRYLLPASLVLLTLSIDLDAIKKLGSKALIMFFAATFGIVIGGPIALYVVSLFAPEVLDGGLWKGLSTVAGSWIGGGANQTAMKEIYGASDKLFSAMIIVDVFVANVFMSVLLFGVGHNKGLNKFFKADDSAIENLKTKMEDFQASIAKVATFKSLIYMLGTAFFVVGLAHFLADYIGPFFADWLGLLKETSPNIAGLLSSLGSGFFWLIVFATIFGVILSFTKARQFEGVGASKVGSIFLYILVATIGMKMNIGELIRDWGVFKYLITIGLIWIMVHAIIIFIVAKLIKAPFFYVAVGSQANVGGAASAPIVAGAFSPSLAPVGALLAVLGYAVGTFGAILCTLLMQALSN